MQLEEEQILAGRYRLVKLLGEGGMGAVWEAIHTITLKPVALKFLKPRAEDATVRERFFREARAASAVRHPNVVKIHDVVEWGGGLFMVMDLLEGESLEALLAREPKLPAGRVCTILGAVVSAVRAAHEAGIVHRDLKPANIFLARSENEELVRVLDFGIAKVLQNAGAAPPTEGKLTATGAVLGTPYYMAPEQVWGEDVDTRADVWALGVVLYECLAGKRPIEGENMGQILKAVATQAIEPLAEVDPTLPPSLSELVAKMLQADRTERLADLEVVAAELAKHVDCSEPIREVPLLPVAVAKVPTKVETVSELATERPAPPVRPAASRRPWSLILAGVAAAAAAAWIFVSPAPSSSPSAAPGAAAASSTAALVAALPSASSAPAVAMASAPEAPSSASPLTASVSSPPRPPARPARVSSSAAAADRSAAPKPPVPPPAAPPSTGAGGLHVPPPF